MILKDIIPEKWRNGFAKLSDDLNEIRLRALAPVKVVCSGKHGYLTESGFPRRRRTLLRRRSRI